MTPYEASQAQAERILWWHTHRNTNTGETPPEFVPDISRARPSLVAKALCDSGMPMRKAWFLALPNADLAKRPEYEAERKRKQLAARATGMCPRCMREPMLDGYLCCATCAKRAQAYDEKQKRNRVAVFAEL